MITWDSLSEMERDFLRSTHRHGMSTIDAVKTTPMLLLADSLRKRGLLGLTATSLTKNVYTLTDAGRALIPADTEPAAQADTIKARVAELEAFVATVQSTLQTAYKLDIGNKPDEIIQCLMWLVEDVAKLESAQAGE